MEVDTDLAPLSAGEGEGDETVDDAEDPEWEQEDRIHQPIKTAGPGV